MGEGRDDSEMVPSAEPQRRSAALAGVVAAGAGLAAGELAAGLVSAWPSPIEIVGDRFIDATPAWLKDLAITWFGTGHRPALTVSMIVVVLGAVGAIAAMTRGRRGVVPVAVAVAILASGVVVSAPGESLGSIVPVVIATAVAVLVLSRLVRLASEPVSTPPPVTGPFEDTPSSEPVTPGVFAISMRTDPAASRRRFLTVTGGVVAASVVAAGIGRSLSGRFSNAVQRAAVILPRPGRRRPAIPADPAVRGLTPLFTPTSEFFRIDTAFSIPRIDPTTWSLRIHGLVDREVTLTYEDLLARPQIEADITLTCVSNEVGGELVGTARWQGVRLDELLAEAGIRAEADQVMGRSTDGFTAGFPVRVLDGRDAIVAVAMNGEILPNRHGFPARLVVPGLYGYVSATKWLREIELTRFDSAEGYWIPRGWSREGPIKIQSRIDVPRGTIESGSTVIAGVAWAPATGIAAVEVQIDDSDWQQAELGPDVGIDAWRQWWIPYEATPGRHRVRCRAIDMTGAVQIEARTPVAPDGATGWHTRTVTVQP